MSKPFILVTPNGPTDGGDYGPNTPGTSTSGIQEAINALPSSGGAIFVAANPGSSYVLSAALTSNGRSNVILEGAGFNSSITTESDAAFHMLNISNSGWIVQNLYFNGANQSTSSIYHCIVTSGTNTTITNNLLTSGAGAGVTVGYVSAGGNESVITDNYCLSCHTDGIVVEATGVLVQGNAIDTTSSNNGISFVTATRCSAIGNYIKAPTGGGIGIENLGGGVCANLIIKGNVIESTTVHGIAVYQQNSGVNSGND